MAKRRAKAFLLAVLLPVGCSVVPNLPSSLPGAASPLPATGAIERQVHDLVNRHRTAAGLSPLAWDATLAALAAEHSRRMASGARPFGHDGFEARIEAARDAAGVSTAAENVASNTYPTAEVAARAVQGWIDSPGHRRNLEGAFQITGVGVARSANGEHYLTQIYAAP